MQSVLQEGTQSEGSWSLGLSVLPAPSGMRRNAGALLGFALGHVREGMRSVAVGKPPLADAVVGFSPSARKGLDIQQVHWSDAKRNWQSAQEALWNVAPLRMQTRLLGRGNEPIEHLRYGVYKATEIVADSSTAIDSGALYAPLRGGSTKSYTLKDACVLMIYPNHQRMDAEGCNVSDPACMAGSDEHISKRIRAAYVFDSWAPQVRFLGSACTCAEGGRV